MRARRRHSGAQPPRAGVRWLVAAAGGAFAGSILLVMAPADATASSTQAQLSFTGVATADNPAGGSVVGIHPGDSVVFKASAAPTAGFAKLGLGALLGPLGTISDYKVTADFSHLPGGHAGTALSGSTAAKFTFAHAGKYSFTWSASAVSGPLGTPVNLDGNQLKQAGVKLNASNQYVGQVVVAKKPPKGGISVQLPSIKVKPSVTGVGHLPTISVPGVNLPTVSASIPKISTPSLPDLTGSPKPTSKSTHHKPSHSGGKTSTAPTGLTVPEQVVPTGDTDQVIGGGGYLPGALPTTAAGPGGGGGSQPLPTTSHRAGGPVVRAPSGQASHARPVDLATKSTSSSSELPVILAIIAVIALTLVAATYARLFLVKHNS